MLWLNDCTNYINKLLTFEPLILNSDCQFSEATVISKLYFAFLTQNPEEKILVILSLGCFTLQYYCVYNMYNVYHSQYNYIKVSVIISRPENRREAMATSVSAY